MGLFAPDLQISSNHASAIAHDVEPHSGVGRGRALNAYAVVLNNQRALGVAREKPNENFPGVAVLDGIVHGFLSDVVKMRRHGSVVNQHGRIALKTADDTEQVLDLAGVQPRADISP